MAPLQDALRYRTAAGIVACPIGQICGRLLPYPFDAWEDGR